MYWISARIDAVRNMVVDFIKVSTAVKAPKWPNAIEISHGRVSWEAHKVMCENPRTLILHLMIALRNVLGAQ